MFSKAAHRTISKMSLAGFILESSMKGAYTATSFTEELSLSISKTIFGMTGTVNLIQGGSLLMESNASILVTLWMRRQMDLV